LGYALQGHLQTVRERGFSTLAIYTDPHASFLKLSTQFPGVLLDAGGMKDYVHKVDAKIRHIKETYRSVKAGLAWKPEGPLVDDCIAYCVTRMNLRRTSALHGVMSPAFLFTGVKPNYQKVFGLSFGDYDEVYGGTTNTSKERSVPCIALYTAGNASGSWFFFGTF
jgi:hypothetical protein